LRKAEISVIFFIPDRSEHR